MNEDFIALFNKVNQLDDPRSPLTQAIVNEFVEACDTEADGMFDPFALRSCAFKLIGDVVRFAEALHSWGLDE